MKAIRYVLALWFLASAASSLNAELAERCIVGDRIQAYRQNAQKTPFTPLSIADCRAMLRTAETGVLAGHGVRAVLAFFEGEAEVFTDESPQGDESARLHRYFEKSDGVWHLTQTKAVREGKAGGQRGSLTVDDLGMILDLVEKEMWGTHGIGSVESKPEGAVRVSTLAISVQDVPYDKREQVFEFQIKDGKWLLTKSQVKVMVAQP